MIGSLCLLARHDTGSVVVGYCIEGLSLTLHTSIAPIQMSGRI